MAQLIVRNLAPELVEELKLRASAHGRSAEEEHREILRSALTRTSLKTMILEMPEAGDDDDFERPVAHEREVTL